MADGLQCVHRQPPCQDWTRFDAFGGSRLVFNVLCLYPSTLVSRSKDPLRSGEGVRFTQSQISYTQREGEGGATGA